MVEIIQPKISKVVKRKVMKLIHFNQPILFLHLASILQIC